VCKTAKYRAQANSAGYRSVSVIIGKENSIGCLVEIIDFLG
jgi:hypothetical protein